MAEKPYASFADYLKRGQSAPAPSMPKVDLSKLKTSAGSGKSNGIPQDPLSWLVDFISRPLYAATETADSFLEAPEAGRKAQQKIDSGDFLGGVGDYAANIGKIASAPLRGLFSTHEDDKRLTSDLIEKGTDTFGKEFNPDYVDEQDNVNPVLKGILGFVGDVAGDPLTYVPGAAIASIGKGIGRGAKAVGSGAKSVTETLKAARTPAEEVIGETTGVRATPEATVADNVDIPQSIVPDTPAAANPRAEFTDGPYEVILHNRSSSKIEKFATKEEADAFTEMLRKEKGWKETKSGNTKQVGKYQIVAPKPAAKATEAIVAKAPASLGEAMRSSEKFGAAKGFLDELSKAPAKAPKAKAPEVEVEYPDLPSWTKGMIVNRPTKVVATRGTEDLTMVDAMRIIGDDLEDYALRKSVRDQVEYEYELAKAAFTEKAIKEARAKGKKLPAKKSKQEDFSTQRARFRSIVSTEEGIAQVEKALGSGLATYLKNPNLSDSRFEATIDKLRSMLDDTGHLDDFDLETRGSPFNKLLKQLGVGTPPTVQKKHIEYQRSQSKVGQATPQSILATMRELGDEVDLDAVTQQARGDVADVLPGILERNLKDVGPEHGYRYISDSGALRTDDIAGFGLGRYQYQVNTHVQMEMITQLAKRITKRVDNPTNGRKLAGPQRAKEIEKQMRAAYGEMARLLDDYGVPIHIDEVFPDRQPVQFPLRFNEVYDTIAATSPEAENVLRMLLFNMKTAMPHSRLLEATARLLADEDFVAPLVSTGSRYNPESEIRNFLAKDDNWGTYGHRAIANNQRNVKNYEPPAGARYVPNKNGKGLFIEYNSGYAREVLTEALRAAKPELLEIAAKNKAIYDERFGEEVYDMTEEVFGKLLALIDDPMQIDNALRAAAAPGKLVKESARNGQVLPQSAAATGAIVEAETAELVGKAKVAVGVAEASTKGGKKGASKGTPEGRKAQQEQFKAAEAENAAVEAMVKATAQVDEVPVETYDVSMKWFGDIQGQVLSIMDPLGRVFRAGHGMQGQLDLYRLKHVSGVLNKTLMGRKIRGLRELSRKYGTPIEGMKQTPLVAAFRAFQKAAPPVGNPQVRAAYDELASYMGETFGTGGVLGNAFFRNNAGVEYINDIFGQYDILGKGKTGPNGTFFDLDEAARVVKETLDETGQEIDLLTAAESQWRHWDVEDPIEFISKLNTAAIRMATDVGVAQSFTRMAIKEGLGSATPQPGMVKLIATGKSKLVRLLDDEFYVDKEVANAFHRMDEVMRTSQSIEGDIGKFIHNVFDPTQNAWKVAITIYRPGHHIRNFFGDESMTYFAEGMKGQKKSMRDAFKVMSLRNNYENVDILKSLNHLDVQELPKAGDVISKVSIKGKEVDVTADGIVAAMMREGLLPPAYVVEDVYIDDALGSATSALKKVMGAVTFKGKAPEKIASGVSEYRDHYSRIKHFIQFIDNHGSEYKSLEDLFSAAGTQVKKWHPDVSLLSTSEAKYMRRLMPFYSWFRGAVPAIGSAIAMNPARINVLNKASYNLAVSMGVNPDSLSDPFPEDQLFPSFLTEQMEGPQFKMPDGTYFRVNPGFASWDVLNMLGGAPSVPEGVVRGVAGASSPLIRMPAEMLSGGSWGTGARINDMSDYLDSAIPGVNYLSNITGTSVTGTLANLGTPDPQFQHAKGNKDGDDQILSFLNYLSGLGVQDYSKQNYINFAEIEKRNREGEQRGF